LLQDAALKNSSGSLAIRDEENQELFVVNETQKRNVAEFNGDIASNGGYQYTTNAQYSAVVANKRMTEAVVRFIPESSKTLVDLGCGDGTYTGELASHFLGMEILGLDPAADAVQRAKRLYPSVSFDSADLLAPETLPKRQFDVGVIRGVIHHLPEGSAGILNAARIARTLIVVEPNGNNPVLKWIERHSQYHIDHEEQSYSSQELTAWCRQAGYSKITIDYIGFIPMFFPTVLAKIIYFFQPVLERIYPLKKYFAGQIVLFCEDRQESTTSAP
jgi:SAM-dependent methyltransferase